MAFGLGRLGWTPEAFWRASPHEIAAAARAFDGVRRGQPIARGAFEALMRAHPDLCGDPSLEEER
jgi:uncharacterized phage protein (TIGR02216 family)